MSRFSNKNKHLKAFFLGNALQNVYACVHIHVNAIGCLAMQFSFCFNAYLIITSALLFKHLLKFKY